jgi:predicted DNA-binding protein with PD1-like motif
MNATLSSAVSIETGHYGRLVVARLKPNEDLVASLEALCAAHGIERAVLRGAVGSLIEAQLARGYGAGEQNVTVSGPGVEILSVSGEIALAGDAPRSSLSGVVADPAGRLYAGRFRRGGNRSFITIEVSLQEWIVEQTQAVNCPD